MQISNALVIGGGIGGLTVATALARRGVAVTLLEQASRLSEVGAGLQVSPNGLYVLRALGLEAALLRKAAVRGEAVHLRNLSNGRTVARVDLSRAPEDQRYYFLHRADLIDVLAAAAKRENVTFEMGRAVKAVHPGETPRVEMEDNTFRRAEMVVAADGLNSIARPLLNGSVKGQFTGQVAWRATVPNTVNHPNQAHVAMGTGRHLVSYPLRGGKLVNLVAVEERDSWAAEGWSHADDPDNLRRAFASAGGTAAELLAQVTDTSLWGLHLHPVAARWAGPGVALLGDAAHPTLPFLAQGANMAMEDAWVLADSLSKAPRDEALAQYQKRRAPRVKQVINAASGNAGRYHMGPGPRRFISHLGLKVVSTLAPGMMLGAFNWLYRHDVTQE